MAKRINIVLPDETLAILDRVTHKGGRSQFISHAVLSFVESAGKWNLRERLKREALENAARDVAMAAEWFPLEQEAFELAARTATKRRSRSPRSKIA